MWWRKVGLKVVEDDGREDSGNRATYRFERWMQSTHMLSILLQMIWYMFLVNPKNIKKKKLHMSFGLIQVLIVLLLEICKFSLPVAKV